jgi:hypothetical protein
LIQCAGTKRDNSPCTATVEPPQLYCWWHDPQNAEQRRRAASRGGRSRPSREVRTIKEEIKEAIGKLERGKLDRNIARAMFSGWGVLLEYIKLERGIKVEDELAQELEAIKRESTHAS